MSITGNLKTMELSELLQWIAQGNKTGTLVIDDGQIEKTVSIKAGRIISSASTDPKEYLGHFLVSHGFIDEHTLAAAMERQEATGILLGKILIELGKISQAELDRMLRLKADESIYDLFSRQSGEFRFVEEEVDRPGSVPVSLEITALVLEGVRRLDEWTRIREIIPSLEAVPVTVTELPASVTDDPSDRQILELVDDDRSVEEILLESHANEFRVCQTLARAVRAGQMKIVRARSRTKPGTQPESPHSPLSLLSEAEGFLDRGEIAAAFRHLRAGRSLAPYDFVVCERAQAIEARLTAALEEDGLALEVVLVPAEPIESLTDTGISPAEGFLLSRFNGYYDLRSILKIIPLPALEARVVCWELLRRGIARIQSDNRSRKTR